MSKRLQIAVAVLLATLVGLAVWEIVQSRRTAIIIEGRPLICWLDENDGSLEAERNAQRVVQKAGTNAIPTLLWMLRQRDTPFKRKVVELAQRQRFLTVHYIPPERRNCEAWVAFETLGARGRGAVSALMEIFDLKISMWSQLYAVKSLGAIGPAARMATPVVLTATTNSHFPVRVESLAALVHIDAEPEVATAALARALTDPNSTVRYVACVFLAQVGNHARPAIPALTTSLNDPVREVRTFAARALKAIDPEAAARAVK